MLQEMPVMSSGGGGSGAVSGNTIKINGAEATATTTTSQEFTVDTGLSAVHHFELMAKTTANQYRLVVCFDENNSGKYDTSTIYALAGGAFGNLQQSIGVAAYSRCISLWSINNGIVTLKSPSEDTSWGICDSFYWFAD